MKNTGAAGGGAINGGRRRSENNDLDDVEKLLQSAQDELILKLSIDSHHTSRSSSQNLHPDLHRRFQALRSQPSSSIAPPPIPPDLKSRNIRADDDGESKAVIGDDLFARFAALKSSISGPAPLVLPEEADSSKRSFDFGEDDDDEEDEVERLIRWAKDAARLDPSPPSDSDVEDEDQIDSPPSSSDEDDFSQNQTKKKKKDPTKSNSKK